MGTIMASMPEYKAVTLDALPTLPQYEMISVNVKVLQLYNTEEVGTDKRIKREASNADHTATTRVVLWEQHVNALEEEKCYHLKTFHAKEFQSKKHLSMPKNDFEITQRDNMHITGPARYVMVVSRHCASTTIPCFAGNCRSQSLDWCRCCKQLYRVLVC